MTLPTRNLSKRFKLVLTILMVLALLVCAFAFVHSIYCNTGFCDTFLRPAISPEMRASQVAGQYELAIQDIDAGRYEIAKQRLEYIISQETDYPGAENKLIEVEKILKATQNT